VGQTSYYKRQGVGDPFVRILTLINLGAAVGTFVAWPNFSAALADPFSLVAGGGRAMSPSAFEYPFCLIWAIPLICVGGAFLAKSLESRRMARLFAAFPSFLAAACVGWLYFSYGYWG